MNRRSVAMSGRRPYAVILVTALLILPTSCNKMGVTVQIHIDCAHAIAEAAFALGAAALFTAAAAGDGLEIAGYIVDTEILGYLGNAANSLTTLEGIAAKYLC